MWIVAKYQPTAFFSLRPHNATTSGGKSLIVPTPFAVKTALLDAAIRTQGLARGKALFTDLRNLEVAVRLPKRVIVNKTFVRILRYNDHATGDDIPEARANRKWPYQTSVGFREYVHFGGPLTLAFWDMPDELTLLLAQVNYLGKRGGFIQLLNAPKEVDELPDDFTLLTEGVDGAFPLGTLQMVDDWGEKLTFERLNIYSDKRITAGKHRVFHHVVLPHEPIRSSRGFTLYERTN